MTYKLTVAFYKYWNDNLLHLIVVFNLLLDPPIWSGREEDQNNKTVASYPGLTTVLNCTVCADPDPSFSWLFNGSSVKSNVTMIGSLLIINNTVETDFGTYTCIARNFIFGIQESSYFNFNVVLYGPPTNPDILVEHRTSVSIHLTWTAGFNGGSDQFYTLAYKTFYEMNYIVWIDYITAQEGEVLTSTIHGLRNNTLYNIRLLATNQNTVGLNQSVTYLNATTLGL